MIYFFYLQNMNIFRINAVKNNIGIMYNVHISCQIEKDCYGNLSNNILDKKDINMIILVISMCNIVMLEPNKGKTLHSIVKIK